MYSIAALRWVFIQQNGILVKYHLKKEKGKNGIYYLDTTKTVNGERVIPMTKQLQKLLLELKAAQESQASQLGSAWKNTQGFVFTHPDGSPINPHLITNWFRKIRKKAGITEKIK